MFHNANKARILGNYQEAATLFKECTLIAPKESTSYYELANLFDNSKQNELALEFAQKAVELDKENYWYRIQYANTLQKNGKTVYAYPFVKLEFTGDRIGRI